MSKRVIIVHCWGGNPAHHWYPWLKKQLGDFEVSIPEMPDTGAPKIDAWVSKLAETVGTLDENTYFVGHSIGCQTIMRYLQDREEHIGGIVFVAGWSHLRPEAFEKDPASQQVADPWLHTPFDWDKVKEKTNNLVAFFSDNDPFVPQEEKAVFEEKLGAKTILEHDKGHFLVEHGVSQVPEVVEELLSM